MWDFLTFRKMMIPVIIQLVFWVGSIVLIVGGVMIIGGGLAVPEQVDIRADHPAAGLVVMILGPIILRLYCELLIVFFRMNDTLTEIRNNTMRKRR